MRPKVITVLGQPFEVIYVKDSPLSARSVGSSVLNAQRIAVLEGQAFHQERDTFLHEVLHMASRMAATPLKERQIIALSPVLLDVLRGNPDVVAYLTEPMVSAGDVPVA